MKRLFLFLMLFIGLAVSSMAQNSKQVKALQKEKAQLQDNLKKSQSELTQTKQKVKVGQQNITFLGQQLDDRLSYIRQLEKEMDAMDSEITAIQTNVFKLGEELQVKRNKLKQAMRYARSQKREGGTLLFVLSAKTLTQMYRRVRYARTYIGYQKNLSEQILKKQDELLESQNLLLDKKSKKNDILREVMVQRKALNVQQVEQRKKVDVLKKQESGLAGKVKEQQKQLAALDKKIDQLIAYEIEQARKKAEEAARKKAEAEAKKKKQAAAAKNKGGGGASKGSGSKNSKGSGAAPAAKPNTWLTAEERQLNGTFEQNRGRLPVPITGQYMLGNRFGMYNVPGLKNVQLDNKGTNYVGKSGARARAVFDGEVTAVFQFGGTRNVLVRHGSYISVYCNLSSVIVSKGQKVHTRDILGSVADDGSGNCVLHFQLRKETSKLNPEAWIGR